MNEINGEDQFKVDEKALEKKIVVGLDGGMESAISLYLLKIQKLDLIAVTIITPELKESDIQEIKNLCSRLSVPHFLIDASSEYEESVANHWIEKKISGKNFNQNLLKQNLIMGLLYEKMLELGGEHLATGHYAKIAGKATQRASDEAHDQSLFVSRLPEKIREALILPLSDLREIEVRKIAENFGVGVKEKVLMPLDLDESKIPESILKKVKPPEEEVFETKTIWLRNCVIPSKEDLSSPFHGFVLTLDGFKPCLVRPKNLSGFLIEFEEMASVKEGDVLSVIKKNSKNSKVYLSGECYVVKGEESDPEVSHLSGF